MLRATLRLVAFVVGASVFAPVMAQEADGGAQDLPPQSAVVTLDRTRLFEETLAGKAILARIDSASNDLISENRRLEAALEAEERDLTERRALLSSADFRALAQEFDTRVEELRVAQETKSRALTRTRDAEQQRFFEVAVPILAELMQELGAVAIIDRSAVILSFDRIDITTQAIAKLDAELGVGDAVVVTPSPDDSTDPATDAPQPAPAQP